MNISAIKHLSVEKPILIISESLVRENIRAMNKKALRNKVLFRPHFKTHQSATIGEWFSDEGIHAITVSSLDMGLYFAEHGWNDMTVSTPVNPKQIHRINELAAKISLNLVADNHYTIQKLNESIQSRVGLFLKIDTGNSRCGILPGNKEEIMRMISACNTNPDLHFAGILIHSGHTYCAENQTEIAEIYHRDKTFLTELKDYIEHVTGNSIMLSIGDTPGCSLVEDLQWADEIRPGNVVFYDLFQWQLGVCSHDQIACVMACPVIGVYPERNEAVIHGGAVHFSKDYLLSDGQQIYGLCGIADENGTLQIQENCILEKLWQEHGLVSMPADQIRRLNPGDVVYVYPVHSCLTVDAVRNAITTEGKKVEFMLK
jgi:D-serine deaminase-like pyridoxal phosphate-dependent protein